MVLDGRFPEKDNNGKTEKPITSCDDPCDDATPWIGKMKNEKKEK